MESAFLEENRANRSMLSCLDCVDVSLSSTLAHNQQKESDFVRDEMKQTEDFLAAELNKLSFQERSEALNDVHCVGEELKETPEMIQQSLVEFERVVQVEKNNVYELACQQNRSYVEDPSFRLKFLRANMHNVGRSVRQMMTFLRCKAVYFGNDKIACDITLNDLNEEDMNLMQSGLFHVQSSRDQTGRVIVWIFNNMLGQCRAETMNRICYYIFFNLICSIPEVQYKGLVTCYYDLAKPGEAFAMPGLNFMMKVLEFNTSIPMRFSAMHHCLKTGKGNLALNNALIGMAMNIFPKDARVRARLHYGSDMELRYQLRSHGFPIESCPVDSNGDIRKDIINDWFHNLRPMDKAIDAGTLAAPDPLFDDDNFRPVIASSPTSADAPMSPVAIRAGYSQPPSVDQTPIVPSRHDVLLGRGRTIQNHPGNVYFRTFLESYSSNYDNAPRNKRRKIATDLVHALKAKGIRFLEQTDNGEWIESNFAEAEKKIGQVFRNTRRR